MTAGARALIRRSTGRLPTRQRLADYQVPSGTSRRTCVARSLVPGGKEASRAKKGAAHA